MEMSNREILELQEAAWNEGVEDLKHDLLHPLHYHPQSTGTDNPYTRRLRELDENPQPRSVRGDDRIREALELFRTLRSRGEFTDLREPGRSDLVFDDTMESILKMGLEEDRGDYDTTPATLLAAAINEYGKRLS